MDRSLVGSPPASPLPTEDIIDWLTSIHLSQYAAVFAQAGIQSLGDLNGLTEENLRQVGEFPTGHWKRILHSLEVLGLDGSNRLRRPPVPFPRHAFPRRGTSCPDAQLCGDAEMQSGAVTGWGTKSLPAKCHMPISDSENPAPRNLTKTDSSTSDPASSSGSECLSESSRSQSSDNEEDYEVPAPSTSIPLASMDVTSPSERAQSFRGEMVINDIYESTPCHDLPNPFGTRTTRSYKLRHRPVPELPDQNSHDWSVNRKSAELPAAPKADDSQSPSGGSRQKAPLQRKVSSITPYGEVFLYNNPESSPDGGGKDKPEEDTGNLKKKKKRKKKTRKKDAKQEEERRQSKDPREDLFMVSSLVDNEIYSTVQAFSSNLDSTTESSPHASWTKSPGPQVQSSLVTSMLPLARSEVHSEPMETIGDLVQNTLPFKKQLDISPYACFYGAPKSTVKTGWLDKLSPQGNCVFQRRWVKFDGENLTYFNNDKEMYSKGLITVCAVKQVRAQGDNRLEVVTSLRTYVFRAEREGERQEWLDVLQAALGSQSSISQKPLKSNTNKCGYVELRGYKGKVCVALQGTKVRLCKTEQDFSAGLAVTIIDLYAASVKHVDKKGFEINTPFKSFCFTAESEREREDWIEALQESIVETLSDYEVAEKIWYNEANSSCADCRAPHPEWASINLVVVICKKCAGQHRFLGPGISQVRSMKLDSSIWSNELVELFLEVGNKNANSFWAANLPVEEELHVGASPEQRATFHRRKYRERKYRRVLHGLDDQNKLNQALCLAVLLPDVLETMALVFSGADVMCATGDPVYSTPYLLAQKAGHRLQMEFLYHNKLSDFPKLDQMSESSLVTGIPSFMDGFLYCSTINLGKGTLDRRGKDDMVRRWFTLEGGFLSYYESKRVAIATGRVNISEVVSLAINHNETMTGSGAVFTFEMYLLSERVQVFGAETAETHRDWARAVTKCLVPAEAEVMLRRDFELIGRLYYKEGHDLYHWRVGWFGLEGSDLHFCSPENQGEEGVMQLKRLQELTVSTHVEGEERIQVLLMVEGGRTLYIHGNNKMDFALWHSAIQLAAGTDGQALSNQQLSKHDIPIAVDSCIAFVTQYGLCKEGIYQRNGDPARTALLLQEFRRDARNVKLRLQDHRLEDITDTLKAFLSESEDALLAKELYPYWVLALDEDDRKARVEKYSTLIHSLPPINRSTLAALLQHLYRIQRCGHINQMHAHSLACVFSPCLFQTKGHSEQEARVVQDLISNYVELFSINEEQVRQMEKEDSFITRWRDAATFSPAGDLIFEVYLEKKEPESCCLIKVSPTMSSAELASCTLSMRHLPARPEDLWTTFEVIENGELERPLHYKEKVLEQVLQWSALDDPGSAFLIIKRFAGVAMEDTQSGQQVKGAQLKFRDGSSKLLAGHRFQERYLMLKDKKLLLYKDIKSAKPERDVSISLVQCYLGLRKKMKPPTSCGFTVSMEKQQWYFCCEGSESQLDWVTSIIRAKHGCDLWPKENEEWKGVGHCVRQRTVSTICRTPKSHLENNRISSRNTYVGEMKARGDEESIHQRNATLIANSLIKKEQSSLPKTADQHELRGKPASPETNQPHSAPFPLSATRPQGKVSQRKGLPGACGVQLPPSLIRELNAVLNKAGRRSPKLEES
ncbi:arf-GAP with Rho-GAP domain, ANK repeat and PH domain-containing protein 2 isoform X2 [Denticeps clupeoides]|uniref:arf-GAP with Rho-GAP domain, ANK repeat and PH domain-containing protein 2 isoform X2 n=1 Tax=Denticeps clupeoides TaxID=299321 RepID=UPI0010A4052D|nr:arf-GAP with Rho-GAP domain, ANK repeat and PH domain-containing protein 2 isoform X2 [Denticeps clupeoides]